jgi:hypothetical protein
LRERFDASARSIGQRLFYGVLGLFAQIGQVNGVIHGPMDSHRQMNADRTN